MSDSSNRARTKKLVLIGLFIALQVIFTRIFSIQLTTVRIEFTFIPLAVCSIMFGPVSGGFAAVFADLIGMMLFPAGAYFPGFTLTAFLKGATYGVLMHNKPFKPVYAVVSVLVVCLGYDLVLNTLWLNMMYDIGFIGMLPGRLVKTAVMIPVQIPMILFLWKNVVLRLKESMA